MRTISDAPRTTRDARRLHDVMVSLGRYRSLRDPLAHNVEEISLTGPQIHTLYWLGLDGALPMGEVAGHCGITEKTITGVVDRLEREGYVQRIRDDRDRRVVRVQLSRKGTATFRRLQATLFERLVRFLSVLDPPDRGQLLQILERLRARLDSDAAASAPPSKHAI